MMLGGRDTLNVGQDRREGGDGGERKGTDVGEGVGTSYFQGADGELGRDSLFLHPFSAPPYLV